MVDARRTDGRRMWRVWVALSLVLAACGGGGDGGEQTISDGGTATTSAEDATASDDAVSPSPAPEGSDQVASGGESVVAGGGETSSPAPSSGGGTEARRPGPPAAGDYRYHTTGSSKLGANPPQAIDSDDTTTIEHLASGRYRQTSTDQTSVLEWTGSQVLLHTMDITRPGFERHFEAKPAAKFAPVPLQIGQSWSWTVKATSYPTTVEQASRVDRLETITVGGTSVKAIVVVTKVTLSGDVAGTIDLTQWVDTATDIPMRIHAKTNITTFAFTSDTTSDFTGFTAR